MDAAENPVATAIDGATGDWSISGDAMRWTPELAERGAGAGDLHLAAADGVVRELRQLPCGTSPEEECGD